MSTALSPRELATLISNELNAPAYKDYCYNGLQLDSDRAIASIVTGVTANDELIDAAIAAKADAILVHHGLFWKNDEARLVDFRYARVRKLIESQLAVLAYHLPLDVHPTLGNNAQLARCLGLEIEGVLATEPLVMWGKVPTAQPIEQFVASVENALMHTARVIGQPRKRIQNVAWCTGAGQNFFEHAVAAGMDVYLTGEISEQHVHVARETGVAFVVAGHHATERYGVQALGAWVKNRTGIAHYFIDVDSPI